MNEGQIVHQVFLVVLYFDFYILIYLKLIINDKTGLELDTELIMFALQYYVLIINHYCINYFPYL